MRFHSGHSTGIAKPCLRFSQRRRIEISAPACLFHASRARRNKEEAWLSRSGVRPSHASGHGLRSERSYFSGGHRHCLVGLQRPSTHNRTEEDYERLENVETAIAHKTYQEYGELQADGQIILGAGQNDPRPCKAERLLEGARSESERLQKGARREDRGRCAGGRAPAPSLHWETHQTVPKGGLSPLITTAVPPASPCPCRRRRTSTRCRTCRRACRGR